MLATTYLNRLEADHSYLNKMIEDSIQFYTTAHPKIRPYFPDIKICQFSDGSVAAEFNGAWAEFSSMVELEQALEQLLAAVVKAHRREP